ncbi:MAG: ABC transporter permease [Phycisphaerales bacterium]|jgi:ABC-type nitrate/sulfonate/bicarbonate transport system permease component|nr:ABC transporter permease [Phycisphaerales bacterium]MBT7171436.1 ABC transporter permease [Phycisphaerales bacterium]
MKHLPRILIASILPAAIVAVWVVAADRSPIIPAMGEVWAVLCDPFAAPKFLDTTSLGHGVAISLLRVALGLGLAVVVGIPLGVAMGISRSVRDALSPMVSVMVAVSPIAWLPISILIFGLTSPATLLAGHDAWEYDTLDRLRFAVVTIIALGSLGPILLNTSAGVRHVRESWCEQVRLLGGGRWEVFRHAVLPGAMGSIVTGLRLATAIAWRVIVAAEIFPGTQSGLGCMISSAHEVGKYEYAFAAILAIAAIGLGLDALLRLWETRTNHWRRKERG